MEPGIVLLTIVTFATLIVLVGMVLRYKQQKQKDNSSASSLKVSELEAIIHRAVEEAVAPLHDRIDDLERQIDASAEPARLSAQSGTLLSPSLPEDDDRPEEVSVQPRRRAR